MPARMSTRRRAVAAGVLALATFASATVAAPAAGAGTGFRAKLLTLINASRERRDLAAVSLNGSLSDDARRHTRKMLRQDEIFDPRNLQEILSGYDWDDLGAAAVGCGATLRGLHRALMESEVHREILLHPRLRRVGIGVIETDERNLCGRGSFWATEIFYG
jgi:uncharacterized protein YkwD